VHRDFLSLRSLWVLNTTPYHQRRRKKMYDIDSSGDGADLAEAEVPLRQRGRSHAHPLRSSDHRRLAGVSAIREY
jgi:hypothetical protein